MYRWRKRGWETGYSEYESVAAYANVVMTDEQMEELRKQIAAYITISEQLLDMHAAFPSQHSLFGMRLENLEFDPLEAASSKTQRTARRQRWTPTPTQLQILERMYEQDTATPNKQRIKDVAKELSQHGYINETNVYNWFQNRRARSKRKQGAGDRRIHDDAGVEERRAGNSNVHESLESFEHIFSSPSLDFGNMDRPPVW